MSVECLFLSCVAPGPLSQQEDIITNISLPNTWGFSLLNLARGESMAVEVCVCVYCNAQHNSSFGIDKVPSYHIVSRVFTCVWLRVYEFILSCPHKLLFAVGLTWLLALCVCVRVWLCVRWNSIWRWAGPGVVTCFSALGRGCDGPLPAGTRDTVSSAF